MDYNNLAKNLIYAVLVVICGFLLFNFTFLLTAIVTNGTIMAFGRPENVAPNIIGRVITIIIVFLITYFVLKSKTNDLVKAVFLTMPMMTILVLIGMVLSNISSWIVGGIAVLSVILALYRKKVSWIYYFSVLYVASVGIYIFISGMDI